MTIDAHLHVGEFPLFNLRLDAAGLADLIERHAIDAGMVFSHDNALVRDVVEGDPGARIPFAEFPTGQRRPGAEQCADGAVAETMRQVDADRGQGGDSVIPRRRSRRIRPDVVSSVPPRKPA